MHDIYQEMAREFFDSAQKLTNLSVEFPMTQLQPLKLLFV